MMRKKLIVTLNHDESCNFRIINYQNNQCEEELKGLLFDPLAVAIFNSKEMEIFGNEL